MATSIYCPHCHKHTSLRMGRWITQDRYGSAESTVARTNEMKNTWWIGICNACSKPVLVEGEGQTIDPSPLPSATDPSIPADLRSDLDEAKMAFSVSCYRASAVLSRRCIQRACIMKGATKHDLVEQIKELTDNGAITKDLGDWANVVRWIGNDAAHPNATAVGKDDASDCLTLAEQFLHVLFVAPALAKAHKAKRGKT